jgi:hypothetical protein
MVWPQEAFQQQVAVSLTEVAVSLTEVAVHYVKIWLMYDQRFKPVAIKLGPYSNI